MFTIGVKITDDNREDLKIFCKRYNPTVIAAFTFGYYFTYTHYLDKFKFTKRGNKIEVLSFDEFIDRYKGLKL